MSMNGHVLFMLFMGFFSLSACAEKQQDGVPKGWRLPTSEVIQKCHEIDIQSNNGLEAYADCVSGHRTPPSLAELDWLRARALSRMVTVQGGQFLQGDFTHLQNSHTVLPMKSHIATILVPQLDYSPYYEEGQKVSQKEFYIPESSEEPLLYNVPSMTVALSDYAISAYMVEEQEYNLFAGAKGYRMANSTFRGDVSEYEALKELPALVQWDRAQAYCQWLGDLVDTPMSLPSEAQWEYAARNRGEYRLFATNDGFMNDGQNGMMLDGTLIFKTGKKLDYRKGLMAKFKSMPSNPLGIYNMQNLAEFVYDWMAPIEQDEKNILVNPIGPTEQATDTTLAYDIEEGVSVEVEKKYGKVAKGGGFFSPAVITRFTMYRSEVSVDDTLAFRCVGRDAAFFKR